jgi:hypothetical protein
MNRLPNTKGSRNLLPQRKPTTPSRRNRTRSHLQRLETIQPPSSILRSSFDHRLLRHAMGYREVRLPLPIEPLGQEPLLIYFVETST